MQEEINLKLTKPRSFRIDDDTAEKFKQITATIGGNQQETLAKLIEVYEFQQGKAVLNDKKSEIEMFENYVTVLTRMYMDSLEDNQNTSVLVHGQYDALLKSKDTVIRELQEKSEKAVALKAEAVKNLDKVSDQNALLTNQLEELKKAAEENKNNYEKALLENKAAYETILSDKDKLNQALSDSYGSLKATMESLSDEYERLKEKDALYDGMKDERDTLLKDVEELGNLLNQEKEVANGIKNEYREKEIALTEHFNQEIEKLKEHEERAVAKTEELHRIHLDKALFEMEKSFRDKMLTIEEGKKTEIDKYQKKYFELLEKIEFNKKDES